MAEKERQAREEEADLKPIWPQRAVAYESCTGAFCNDSASDRFFDSIVFLLAALPCASCTF